MYYNFLVFKNCASTMDIRLNIKSILNIIIKPLYNILLRIRNYSFKFRFNASISIVEKVHNDRKLHSYLIKI